MLSPENFLQSRFIHEDAGLCFDSVLKCVRFESSKLDSRPKNQLDEREKNIIWGPGQYLPKLYDPLTDIFQLNMLFIY